MYDKMPCGLMNAGETFQHAMDIAFATEKTKFIVVYLDDITIFSQLDEEHLRHLKQAFQKCRKFGLSLNPKKSLFAMEEGRMLGHIVTSKGICIDPDRVDSIKKINIPRNKKEIQPFLGKVNIPRRFFPNYTEITKEITSMLRKGTEIKWGEQERNKFTTIKLALTEAPILVSPNFSKEFLTFSFASQETIVVVLLQKKFEGHEPPISFYSRALRDEELKYSLMEKKAYALVKTLKSFRVYILHSQIIAYVPTTVVKDILIQLYDEGKRGKWIENILEYDLNIRPTELIKGRGLAHLLVGSNCQAMEINSVKYLNHQNSRKTLQICLDYMQYECYKDIVHFCKLFSFQKVWINQNLKL